jgi:mevalonate pyrophosphate decarboxylase
MKTGPSVYARVDSGLLPAWQLIVEYSRSLRYFFKIASYRHFEVSAGFGESESGSGAIPNPGTEPSRSIAAWLSLACNRDRSFARAT